MDCYFKVMAMNMFYSLTLKRFPQFVSWNVLSKILHFALGWMQKKKKEIKKKEWIVIFYYELETLFPSDTSSCSAARCQYTLLL